MRATTRAMRSSAMALILTGCTLATDAGDRQVDPAIDRRLDFTFVAMGAHGVQSDGGPQTLDAVVVRMEALPTDKPALVSRARIVLPPLMPGEPYPDEHLVQDGVFGEGDYQLWFYVDSDGDNVIKRLDPLRPGEEEHIWKREVPEQKRFEHALSFQHFVESDFTTVGDLRLLIDAAMEWKLSCPQGVEQTLEVKVFLGSKQVGLYRNYGSNPPPSAPVVLKGIADPNSTYLIQTFVNGTLVKSLSAMAPATTPFPITFRDWYPLPGTLSATPACPED